MAVAACTAWTLPFPASASSGCASGGNGINDALRVVVSHCLVDRQVLGCPRFDRGLAPAFLAVPPVLLPGSVLVAARNAVLLPASLPRVPVGPYPLALCRTAAVGL